MHCDASQNQIVDIILVKSICETSEDIKPHCLVPHLPLLLFFWGGGGALKAFKKSHKNHRGS